jgi:hypothetical protein
VEIVKTPLVVLLDNWDDSNERFFEEIDSVSCDLQRATCEFEVVVDTRNAPCGALDLGPWTLDLLGHNIMVFLRFLISNLSSAFCFDERFLVLPVLYL